LALKDDIARLIHQEENLRFSRFDEEDAWALGLLMQKRAAERKLPLVIDIRHRGRPLFYTALAGTTPDNPEWVRRKCNVVFRYHRSSYRMGRELALKGKELGPGDGVDPAEYATHGGSFPIHVKGVGIVGAVTVSGIPQREDHNFTIEMISEYLNIPHDEVKLGPESVA
jgi:uncharacterized protein (UPF0303 family)